MFSDIMFTVVVSGVQLIFSILLKQFVWINSENTNKKSHNIRNMDTLVALYPETL